MADTTTGDPRREPHDEPLTPAEQALDGNAPVHDVPAPAPTSAGSNGVYPVSDVISLADVGLERAPFPDTVDTSLDGSVDASLHYERESFSSYGGMNPEYGTVSVHVEGDGAEGSKISDGGWAHGRGDAEHIEWNAKTGDFTLSKTSSFYYENAKDDYGIKENPPTDVAQPKSKELALNLDIAMKTILSEGTREDERYKIQQLAAIVQEYGQDGDFTKDDVRQMEQKIGELVPNVKLVKSHDKQNGLG